jgi:hypothetical protein
MYLRQLHDHDLVETVVTDHTGKRQGLLLAKSDQWCWVSWDDCATPVTEHVDDVWICDTPEPAKEGIRAFVPSWLSRLATA